MISSLEAAELGLRWEEAQAWAETRTTRSLVARPTCLDECAQVITFARKNGLTICPRGAGYSYADMILNDGQIILDTSRMKSILSWDERNGCLVAEPGVTFSQVLQETLGSCWTIASCVGGMGVTLGGAVSNNVHGKDSWKVGNFGDHVINLKLLSAAGKVITVDKIATPDLFRAVVGGMGLLGVIVEVTLQLKKISSPFVEVTTISVRDLSESLDVQEEARGHADFMIAWVDAFANGESLGRGTVEIARWIDTSERIDRDQLAHSMTASKLVFGLFPARLAWGIGRPFFRPEMIMLANAIKHSVDSRRGKRMRKLLFTDYNFMLNKIPGWKQLYRPYGYVEFQPLVPRKAGVEAAAEILRMCQANGMQSLLCGVKPHPADQYMLSYEGDGYSVGVDIALRGRDIVSVRAFARKLYHYVAEIGGKQFLAKDELLPRDLFKKMYPQSEEFLQVKRRIDPEALFASDMYRRLLA